VELRQYLSVLRSRLWLILAATVLAAGVGFTLSSSSAVYEARSTLYVGARTPIPSAGDLSNDRLAALDRIELTFSKMIDSKPVATRALRGLAVDRTPDQLVSETVAEPEPSTQLLYIKVRDRDPKVAQTLSNALADTFVNAVQQFEPGTTEGNVPTLPAYVFERAERPTGAERTGHLRTTLLATAFGLLAGAAIAFLLDYLDVSLRTPADVERHLELPVLGVVPVLGGEAPFGDLTATPVAPPRRAAPAKKARAPRKAR
jgi:capsular polysaccharide biosynthesis protein